MAFKPAKKIKAKLRLCLIGGPGTGKTKSALKIAEALCPGGRIAVIDTENESAAKYANSHEFDHDSLAHHSPVSFAEKIKEAEAAGYDCLIIDSLSHSWMGTDGALELVDKRTRASNSGNSFSAWGHVSPLIRTMIETILRSPMHIICTVRAKLEYAQEKNEKTGKTEIRKIGMQPVMRDGIEYEFDLVGDLDQEHKLHITKSRCDGLQDEIFVKPGKELADRLIAWLNDGDSAPAAEPTPKVSGPSREERIDKGVAMATGKGLDELLVRNEWASILFESDCDDVTKLSDADFENAVKTFATWIKNAISEHEAAQNTKEEAHA